MTVPKLIVLSEQLRGQVFELKNDRYRIGRRDDMEICLVDPTVSSLHCELIRNEDGGYTVVDEGYSTNGTRINGMLVTRQKLKNNDLLQVGGIECLYDAETDSVSSYLSTQTHIRLDNLPFNPNSRGNLDTDSLKDGITPQFRFYFRMAMVVLMVFIVFLIGILIHRIFF